MYPNLYFFFKQHFGIEIHFLKVVNTFGFFVALAFMAAAFILQKEFKRKEKEGLLRALTVNVWVGMSAGYKELFGQFAFGFVLGFKLLGLFVLADNPYFNPQQYIFSFKGNIWLGLLAGGLLAYMRYYSKKKKKLPQPKLVAQVVHPFQRIGDLTVLAFIGGFIGAKVFHNLENWHEFIQNPIGELFSLGGLTFYGGLLVAGAAILLYVRSYGMNVWVVLDAFGPALMLAYAVGRLGCHFSGDGDWGILNAAFISDLDAHLVAANSEQFQQALVNNTQYYTEAFGSLDQVPYHFWNPGWLPRFLVANNYYHNVLNEGFYVENCGAAYCAFLPVSVFPTPLYEALICFLLFALLWKLKNKLKITGYLTAVYLFLVGIERFFIEKIRVNTKYEWGGLSFTQAELISTVFIFTAVIIITYHRRRYKMQLQKEGK